MQRWFWTIGHLYVLVGIGAGMFGWWAYNKLEKEIVLIRQKNQIVYGLIPGMLSPPGCGMNEFCRSDLLGPRASAKKIRQIKITIRMTFVWSPRFFQNL